MRTRPISKRTTSVRATRERDLYPAQCPRAFTLIELLVVIGIITILISLLLPGLSGARETGRRVVCMSNQKQIATALYLYAGQYAEYVPREGTVLGDQTIENWERARISWAVGLRPFLDDRAGPQSEINDGFVLAEYYRCPTRNPDQHNIHYISNGFPFIAEGVVDLNANTFPLARRGPARLDTVPFPEETIYIAEFTDDRNGNLWRFWQQNLNQSDALDSDLEIAQFYDAWWPEHLNRFSTISRVGARRHSDRSNILYLDGHVENETAATVEQLRVWDDKNYQPPYSAVSP